MSKFDYTFIIYFGKLCSNYDYSKYSNTFPLQEIYNLQWVIRATLEKKKI